MKLHPSPWDFKGIPSQIGSSLGQPKKAPKDLPKQPGTFGKGNLNASINTETLRAVDKTRKLQRGSMR